MRFLVFFCFLFLLIQITLSEKSLQEQWNSFKIDFSKKYESKEEGHRYKIFTDNLKKIERHNKKYESGQSTFYQGINQFADKTFKEYLNFINIKGDTSERDIVNETETVSHLNYTKIGSRTTKYEIDWSQKGAVTDVKNQGACGSCYAFAAVGALEAAHWKLTGKLVKLSEQNVVDCSKNFKNNGCLGGIPHKVYDFIKNNSGIATEESYPYEGIEGECRFKSSTVGARVKKYDILKKGDENLMKAAIHEYGPIASAIDAGFPSIQFYAGGVLYEPKCIEDYSLNHAILVVGYGTENGQEFWKLKNSFGTGWGDKGYILFPRNINNHCGIGHYSVVVTADPPNTSDSTNFITTVSPKVITVPDTTFANVVETVAPPATKAKTHAAPTVKSTGPIIYNKYFFVFNIFLVVVFLL